MDLGKGTMASNTGFLVIHLIGFTFRCQASPLLSNQGYIDIDDLTDKPSIPQDLSDLSDTGNLLATDFTGYATTSYVDTQVSNLVDTAPEALNTLNELSAALGDDANFATTTSTPTCQMETDQCNNGSKKCCDGLSCVQNKGSGTCTLASIEKTRQLVKRPARKALKGQSNWRMLRGR